MKKANQKTIDAQNFLEAHRGYLKWGKKRLQNKLGLSEEELNIVLEGIRNNTTFKPEDSLLELDTSKDIVKSIESLSNDEIVGYWLKGKYFSAYFRRKTTLTKEEIINFVKNTINDFPPININVEDTIQKGDSVGILNIYDIHIDKAPIDSDGNGAIIISKYIEEIIIGVEVLLKQAEGFNMYTVILPLGGDLFNTNGFEAKTKKGTPQRVLVPHHISFGLGVKLSMYLVDRLVKKGFKVYIPIIYGNHDHDVDFYFGTLLELLYRDLDRVEVDNNFVARKYYKFGNNMFAFGHGDLEKGKVNQLPLIMATENPYMWAATKNRTFYLGDIHHKEEYKFMRIKDYPGCTVSFLRSVSYTDKWHHDNMYIGVQRTMELNIHDLDKGNICDLMYNL